MPNNFCTPYYAGRLIYRSLAGTERELKDAEHRDLISEFISNSTFRDMVNDIARGLELTILDASTSGLVLAPANAESKFAVKISDLKTGLDSNQKVGLLLSQIVIAATFFPTTETLEDESYLAPPASLLDFRNNLESFLHRIKEAPSLERDDDGTIAAGWQFLLTLPQANPNSDRAALNSLSGYLKTSINHLEQGGMLVIERKSMTDEQTLYAPTFRMRVHLREFALQQIYDLARSKPETVVAAADTTANSKSIAVETGGPDTAAPSGSPEDFPSASVQLAGAVDVPSPSAQFAGAGDVPPASASNNLSAPATETVLEVATGKGSAALAARVKKTTRATNQGQLHLNLLASGNNDAGDEEEMSDA